MTNSSPTTNGSTKQSGKEKSPNGSKPLGLDPSETTPTPTLRENLIKKAAYLKLGERAYQLEKDQGRQRLVERLVRKTQDGTLGKATDDKEPDIAKDDMSVQVGDTENVTHHHHYAPPEPAQQEPAKPEPTKDSTSAMGKWALAGGLLAAGLGGGALATAMMRGNDTTPPAVSLDDSNTRYGLKLYQNGEEAAKNAE
jgi:hypothetical protein